ncbi:MAG: polysaccharide deacetylase [Rhizobiaceae bacterium]|nr:polysaccharide deacetylase [Rhizobiaceae bacterium]MCV0405621.1 polysaccharide deacetylase [Rhizobiaceae bacterium]
MRCVCLVLSVLLALPAAAGEKSRPVQQVIISFDGAHDNAQWERSLKLAAETGARFTYFLSCVFLLSRETRSVYRAPSVASARSNVGFAESRDDVAARLGHVWRAHLSGHEIASHGCGHFDGAGWSKTDWLAEFDAFSDVVTRAWEVNGIKGEPEGWRTFAASASSSGFRAPYLATGEGLFAALAERGFSYDASTVSRGPAKPSREGAVTRFSLPLVPEGPSARRVIAMDYNLFVRHSAGLENAGRAAEFEERAYAAFRAAFDAQYEGERIPLQLGFHFTLMNGGAYWAALERFAREVCVLKDVACIPYRDAVEDGVEQATHGG